MISSGIHPVLEEHGAEVQGDPDEIPSTEGIPSCSYPESLFIDLSNVFYNHRSNDCGVTRWADAGGDNNAFQNRVSTSLLLITPSKSHVFQSVINW